MPTMLALNSVLSLLSKTLLTLLVIQEAIVRPVHLNNMMSTISHLAPIYVPMSTTTRGMKCTESLTTLKMRAMKAGLQ